MTIIDVGAGAGVFAAYTLTRWPEAKIICYEASQRGVTALKLRFANEPRVTIIHGAVVPDGTKGPVKLYCGNDYRDSSLIQSEATLDTYELCPAIPLSSLPEYHIINIEMNGGEKALSVALGKL